VARKAQAALFIVFIFFALIIIIISAVVAPMGARFSAELFAAGENILNDSVTNPVQKINNPEIKASLESTFNSAIDASETNIEVSTGLFQYAWVLLLILTGVVLFLVTRSIVAFSRSGGGVV